MRKSVSYTIEEDLINKISIYAKELDISSSKLVNTIIDNYVRIKSNKEVKK